MNIVLTVLNRDEKGNQKKQEFVHEIETGQILASDLKILWDVEQNLNRLMPSYRFHVNVNGE